MSASEHRKQRQSELRDDGTGDDDDDGEEEDNKEQHEEEDGGSRSNGVGGEKEKEKEVGRKRVIGISRDFRSAIKRSFGRRRKEKEKATADGENRRSPSSRGGGCYGCFRPPMTEECPETPTSDPNSERFNFEMLRALIESNDFYCEESNPHI